VEFGLHGRDHAHHWWVRLSGAAQPRLTASSFSPDLFIVARATEKDAERRMVDPFKIGRSRTAQMVVKPTIVSFFDASPRA
jgi:hypothetical protein